LFPFFDCSLQYHRGRHRSVTDLFFEKKDKLIGGLGEEKIKDSKIVNNIKWMVRFATGEGQGISASVNSLSLLDLRFKGLLWLFL
jgi:hypothetical protein